MRDKKHLRQEALARRKSLPPRAHWEKSRRITAHLVSWPVFRQARRVLLYASLGDEVATWQALKQALALKKEVYLPRTLVSERALSLHRLERLTDLFPGAYGILEPPERAPRISPRELDLIVCPGVAFDIRGGRIGYGGGYYDRLLSQAPEVKRVALAFSCQLFEELPLEPHDIRMQTLITEEGRHHCAIIGAS